jgi:hypothetical protein
MNQTNSFHMLSESDTSPEDSAENITNPPNYHSSTKDPGKIRILDSQLQKSDERQEKNRSS